MDTPPVEPGDPELTAFWLRFFRRIVAALQVGGGLYGLYNVAVSVQYSVSRVVLLLAFVLFAASVSGGILLALDRPCGVTISLFVQALQVFQIAANGLVYSFVCDMELMFSINPSGEEGWAAHLVWYYPSHFYFSTGSPSDVPQIVSFTAVNLVAVLAIVCLLCVRMAYAKQESGQAAVY